MTLDNDEWWTFIILFQAIYHTLNLFNLDVTQKCLIAECWIPVADMETIQMALRRGTVILIGYCLIDEQTKCYSWWIGTKWKLRAPHSESDDDPWGTTDVQSHQ